MPLRIVPIKDPEAKKALESLFEVVAKCTKWGEYGEQKLQLSSSRIKGRIMFLRYSASNRFLAVNPALKRVYLADMDLVDCEEIEKVDLDDIEAITTQLEKRVKSVSPIDL